MRHFYIILFPAFAGVLSFGSSITSYGQDTEPHRAQAVYAEAGGAGYYFSGNYDIRLTKSNDGLGVRTGFGYSFNNKPSVLSVPLMVNYLLGHDGNYFEAGAGVTYLHATGNEFFKNSLLSKDILISNDDLFVASMNFGYRRQPVRGGLNFRVGAAPYFWEGRVWQNAYLGLGVNF